MTISCEIIEFRYYDCYSEDFVNDVKGAEEFNEKDFVKKKFQILVFNDSTGIKLVETIAEGDSKAKVVSFVRKQGFNLTRQDISNKNVKIKKNLAKNMYR